LGGWVIGGALGVGGLASAAPTNEVATTTFEARQGNDGTYSTNVTGQGFNSTVGYRLGFQSNFGSGTTTGAGGMAVVHYFQLPQLNGGTLNSVHFLTSLIQDTASSQITPRFSADLYGVGYVRDPAVVTDPAATSGSYFYASNTADTAAAPGTGQPAQLLQRNFFTLIDPTFSSNHDNVPTPGNTDYHFPDSAYVNSATGYNGTVNGQPVNTSGKTAFLVKGTTATGDQALLDYILGVYASPGFVDDGQNYLVLRLNPDYQANVVPPSNSLNGSSSPAASGTTRYVMAGAPNTNVDSGFYAGATAPTLTLDITPVPEPGVITVLGLSGVGLLGRRRRAAGR
jgi:hypothetical protein